ncbi:DUF2939 domain-containing protein [Oryzomicrobium terrae]|nr:DUF2939 domain-containing protein [Oryzomicrobium terrae]
MRKGLIALAAVAFGGWYYATPYISLAAMKAAAKAKDSQALSAYVDYPALRENLKDALRPKAMEMMARESAHNPMAGTFGAMVANTMINATIDTFVTPEGLATLVRGDAVIPTTSQGKPTMPTDVPPPSPATPSDEQKTTISTGYAGWNHFEMTATDRYDPTRRTTLILARQGFASWKLVGMKLPL